MIMTLVRLVTVKAEKIRGDILLSIKRNTRIHSLFVVDEWYDVTTCGILT